MQLKAKDCDKRKRRRGVSLKHGEEGLTLLDYLAYCPIYCRQYSVCTQKFIHKYLPTTNHQVLDLSPL